jgi:hypothetical protein
LFINANVPIPLTPGSGRIYVDAGLTTGFNGQNQWWLVFSTNQSVQIDEEGTMLEVVNC